MTNRFKIIIVLTSGCFFSGNAVAQFNLGNMYRIGEGVAQNYKTGVQWNRLAAEKGHSDAQYNLSISYDMGLGVLKDYVYAHMWANIAASNGTVGGASLRDSVEAKMTSADISKAQNLAREFVAKFNRDC